MNLSQIFSQLKLNQMYWTICSINRKHYIQDHSCFFHLHRCDSIVMNILHNDFQNVGIFLLFRHLSHTNFQAISLLISLKIIDVLRCLKQIKVKMYIPFACPKWHIWDISHESYLWYVYLPSFTNPLMTGLIY